METGWNYQNKDSSAKLGSLIESLLSRLGLAHSVGGWNIVNRWPEIVGDKIAAKSKAVRFENDTLMVSVPDSSWRQELLLSLCIMTQDCRRNENNIEKLKSTE
jgi:predicted nucleic acid-binding Zn ribbon protein